MNQILRCTGIRLYGIVLAFLSVASVALQGAEPNHFTLLTEHSILTVIDTHGGSDGEWITQQEPVEQSGKIKVNVVRSVSSESIKLTVTFPADADPIKISLHNLLGRQLSVLSAESAFKGESEFQFDTRDLPNGHYFVVVEALGQRITKKVLVSR